MLESILNVFTYLIPTLCNLVQKVIRQQKPKASHQVRSDLESGIGTTPTSSLGLDLLLTAIVFVSCCVAKYQMFIAEETRCL